MTKTKPTAFYAPIKPPDHPIPSGDRLIAGNLVKALEIAGHNPVLASRYIAYSKRSDSDILESQKAGALAEADRLIGVFEAQIPAQRPKNWVTYHPYCKAPDWIGPRVSRALGIPYLTIEAAKTGQGGVEDAWQQWRKEAQTGLKEADLHLVMKPSDRAYLTELLGSDQKLHAMAPFMDTETGTVEPATLPHHWDADTPVLVTTGMMRKGKKDKNFYMLAEILTGMRHQPWNLVIVGGGPEEASIRSAFKEVPNDRVHWTGQIEREAVLRWMQASDLFVWPGWKEPIGMVYLEAQLLRLPVIAYESMGVPLVVEHGETGLLAAEEDMSAMRNNISRLLADTALRNRMGEAGRKKVLGQHSIEAAATTLSKVL